MHNPTHQCKDRNAQALPSSSAEPTLGWWEDKHAQYGVNPGVFRSPWAHRHCNTCHGPWKPHLCEHEFNGQTLGWGARNASPTGVKVQKCIWKHNKHKDTTFLGNRWLNCEAGQGAEKQRPDDERSLMWSQEVQATEGHQRRRIGFVDWLVVALILLQEQRKEAKKRESRGKKIS